MNDKNIEEKAKEYAKKICEKSCRSKCEVSESCTIYKERIKNFITGYTQAATDQSDTLTQYKEALREIVKECEDWVIPGADRSNNCESNHYVETDDLKSLIAKAKQLLNNE